MLSLTQVDYAVREPTATDDGLTVRDVTLSIAPGEFVALVGRNGSGKTTLARLMNGLYLPTRGRVVVEGLDTAHDRERWDIRRRVGMVFQNPDHQIVASMVCEEVAFGPENFGVPPDQVRHRVEAALAATHLSQHARRPPHSLSGGQKQRLAIASLLALEPQYMVLDEPTTMLDPEGRAEVMAAVLDLHRTRRLAVILITHAMEEACLADRVVVLEGGRLVVDSPPAALFSDPSRVEALGLEPPPMALLGTQLRLAGIPVPPDVLSVQPMVDWLLHAD